MGVRKPSCCPAAAVVLGFVCLFLSVGRSSARAATEPSEVDALNAILGRWGQKASPAWNISGEPCTGAAIDDTSFDDPDFNPAIKCDCSHDGNTTCRITQLRVYALDVEGLIPEELQNFKYLNNLDLRDNYLTGPLPAFIGNFTAMKALTVGANALSGTIPKELGNLQNLLSLSFTTNNFSGSIPPELGNLTSLQKLYIHSCGVGGELPSTLSKLKNLRTFWASDNDFTGKIPEFIGSLTSLTDLRLQGNSFEGPIPSSFSNLTKLSNLRIGDILNGSSSLGFISSLTSLNTLILRNSRISDALPSDFSQYASLQRIFLGNNSLSGNLPTQKSESLLIIDLSYNQLSGSFPSWVSEQNLQLNLVANNFVIASSIGSILPAGLHCLQRDIPCYRGSPVYSSFAINCGGSETVTTSSGTVFEIDNKTLTDASYYVTNINKWAISSVGSFMDASNAEYIFNSPSQFINTQTSELFQTERLSPSSLRYYGLGLENGNYTVELQFAEAAIHDPPDWRSVGRRIFDIYIQGNHAEKDFDIRKEANGASYKAVVKTYTAPVTNNFLEIHFFWAGKGTCCVPTQGYYGASISALSVSPKDFIPTVSNEPPTIISTNKRNMGLIAGVAAGSATLGLLTILGIFIWRQKGRKPNKDDDGELLEMSARPDTFSYAELKAATDDFHPMNKLGEGGFGPVFKGTLSDGRIVAVKQLSAASHQGKRQFMTEIATISAVQHRNLVKLYGCCIEGDKRLLVYEYLVNKSLDQAIFGDSRLHLDWPTRFEICVSTARGLAYLHEESSIRIVHRDVKASNILLDADLKPKISDFGLAKLYDEKKTHISTRVAGTIGYVAPEYALRGRLTEKADVFAFGVVALEVISGRSNADESLKKHRVYLLEWAWHLHENKRELEIIDPMLPCFNEEEAARVIGVALLCTQASPMLRPHMSRVVAMLMGDIEVSDVMSGPGYLSDWHFTDTSSNFTSDGCHVPSSMATAGSQVSVPSNVSMRSDAEVKASPSQPIMQEFIDEGW